jgi:hypothetical protein
VDDIDQVRAAYAAGIIGVKHAYADAVCRRRPELGLQCDGCRLEDLLEGRGASLVAPAPPEVGGG